MNEGFKALPEQVQRKINPEMAEQFMGGGAVLQRPLFRQMGGPAQPMPQDMMPAAPASMPEEELMQVEGSMEQVGRDYVGQMMGNIDAAEDVTSMIDALRGNEAPIEQRYAELAQFVGEADAGRTPESVLAMVQPTIMMTEQGVVDSGIGQLMQGIASSEMEDEMGRATEMGQGVGELMARGAGNTPPVNFNQGGEVAVRKFQAGTPETGNLSQPSELMSLNPYLQRAQSARENILGSPAERAAQLDEQKKLSKAQMFFDLAQTALAAGAPTDRPMSAAERIINATQQTQFFDRLGQRASDFQASKDLQRQQDQQMRLSALDSAEKSLAAQEERGGRMALEELKIEADNQRLDKQLEAQIAAATTAFDRQGILNEKSAEYEERIANLRISATAAEGTANRKLQERLQTAANSLQEKLVGLRADANLGNSVAMFNLQSALDLEKMEMGQEFEIAKMNTMQGYETIAAEKQMAFTAAQNALNRMVTRGEGAKNRSFQAEQKNLDRELNKELTELGLDETAKSRVLSHAQFMITSAQKDHQLLQGDEQLTLNNAIAGVDAQYKAEKLALEREAMNVVKLGSDAKSDQIKYITNAERLNQYANGELGDNATTFEQAILDYMKPTETWDSALGKYVQGKSPDLAPRVKKAIQAGSPEFFNQLFGGGGTPAPAIAADDGPIDLSKKAPDLMTPDGKVNLKSPLFDRADPTLFKPEVDYSMAIGASRVIPGVSKAFSEGASEFGIGEGTGPEGQNLSQAQKDLTTLANRLFSLTVDKSHEDRVLKTVQEKLEKEVDGIRPGGFLLKNDADALAGLKTMASSLALIIELNATKVPEFGGNAEGYKTEQVTRARDAIISSVLVLNEVLAFQKQFEMNVSGAMDRTATDQGVDAAVNFLDNLVPKQ
jgi:hypothetical protein